MMTPERWQQVRSVLGRALELSPQQRPKFLDAACSTDPALRSEVESLISADERAGPSFLETPPLQPSELPIGTRLDDYEIMSRIGSGGMGVVYAAFDHRLGRNVAIKVLPAHLSLDVERLRRFEQEARSAAVLNHPNILAVYQLGTYNGGPYLVSELLEGQTLRQILNERPLSQGLIFEYGIQIADGLSAAHARGIIHRDLKPENLFITNDGRVKILDFGLAKLAKLEREFEEPSSGSQFETSSGVIAGTVGYMSPEQLRGDKLDVRTDLFSFGVVLYEMATFKRPFDGNRNTICDQILVSRPTPTRQLNPEVSPELESIITRAIEKDLGQRYQRASQIATDLRSVKSGTENTHAKRNVLRFAAVAIAGILAVGGGFYYRLKSIWNKPEKQIIQHDLTANPLDNPVLAGSISPDGEQLAYADRKHGVTLLDIDSGRKREILNDSSLLPIGWYPDGKYLLTAGQTTGGLWKTSRDGAHKLRLLDESDSAEEAAVSPDGGFVAFVKHSALGEIWIMGPDGESPQKILELPSENSPWIDSLSWSPTSERIIYSWHEVTESKKNEAAMASCDRDGKKVCLIMRDARLRDVAAATSTAVWSHDGRLIFRLQEQAPNSTDSNLWSLRVDPNSGQVQGKPVRVTSMTGVTHENLSQALSTNRLIFQKLRERDEIRIGEINPHNSKLVMRPPLADELWEEWDPRWTNDGRFLLFVSDPQGRYGIFQRNLETFDTKVLLSGPDHYGDLVLTPDEKWLLYTKANHEDWRLASPQIVRMPVDGGPSTLLITGNYTAQCASQTNLCVLCETRNKRRVFSAFDPMKGKGPVLNRVNILGAFANPMWSWALSPDGRMIATFTANNGSRIEIVRTDDKQSVNITILGGELQSMSWAPDNRVLYVTNLNDGKQTTELLRVTLDGKFEKLFDISTDWGWIVDPRVSPDGHRLAFVQRSFESNLTMLENY